MICVTISITFHIHNSALANQLKDWLYKMAFNTCLSVALNYAFSELKWHVFLFPNITNQTMRFPYLDRTVRSGVSNLGTKGYLLEKYKKYDTHGNSILSHLPFLHVFISHLSINWNLSTKCSRTIAIDTITLIIVTNNWIWKDGSYWTWPWRLLYIDRGPHNVYRHGYEKRYTLTVYFNATINSCFHFTLC